MKLTWFGGTAIRIHIGGQILVADAGASPPNVDRAEVLSGADRRFSLAAPDSELSPVDPRMWRPATPARAIDDPAPAGVAVHRLGDSAVLVAAPGESPLVLATGPLPPLGRWASDAVVVFLYADRQEQAAIGLLDATPPRLLALAAPDAALDAIIEALRPRLGDTGLVALEPGLAIEA